MTPQNPYSHAPRHTAEFQDRYKSCFFVTTFPDSVTCSFRLLAAKEPTTEELLQKIDTLQRRVLKKTEEVEKQELVVDDLKRTIGELQQTIERLPGPKEAEALAAARRSVKVGDVCNDGRSGRRTDPFI